MHAASSHFISSSAVTRPARHSSRCTRWKASAASGAIAARVPSLRLSHRSRVRSSLAVAATAEPAPQYSAELAADEWARRPVPVVARLLEIGGAFFMWWASMQLHRDSRRAAADMRKVRLSCEGMYKEWHAHTTMRHCKLRLALVT